MQTKQEQNGNVFALSSNEEHAIMVQQVLFEKYWNELKSLVISNG
ncbi:hypothetical protein [Candidatus Nitrosocosmicus sp. T]